MPTLPETKFKDANIVRLHERDAELDLDEVRWPVARQKLKGWSRVPHGFRRIVSADQEHMPRGPITETILRFPSAQIHGLHRLHEHHFNVDETESFHTYRVLSAQDTSKPVGRIFLLHNGLNELHRTGIYYQLASNLIAQDDGRDTRTVCILRPFPGHLTRSPFQAFAETPLDRFLWDGAQLFRQFLRHMTETQWLLSAIVRHSTYRYSSGANLLAEAERVLDSRLDPKVLGNAIRTEWKALHDASVTALDNRKKEEDRRKSKEEREEDESLAPKLQPVPRPSTFIDAVRAIRSTLNLDRDFGKRAGDARGRNPEPTLHVIGYSLGGFAAQSVFMSWPFLINSCSTLLSGGALRELTPTAFAHPEEWQTVLHSLRYELDDAMASGLFTVDAKGRVGGIDHQQFLYLKRTFYEVFQQEYRGSFQSRVAAFRQRMLFVVGGNDPIVRPRSVLDSGPPGGMNIVTIGGLGHFLGSRADDEEEERQRRFWLPELGRLIDSFAGEADAQLGVERPLAELDADGHFRRNPYPEGKEPTGGPLKLSERLEVDKDGALPEHLFERSLTDLIARVEGSGPNDGVLLILRNEAPTMMLGEAAIQQHASVLHHDDLSIARYIHGVRKRYEKIRTLASVGRVAMIFPWNVRRTLRSIDAHPGYPSQAESASGELQLSVTDGQKWNELLANCYGLLGPDGSPAVGIFDGRTSMQDHAKKSEALRELLGKAPKQLKMIEPLQLVPSLPDCWVWVSREALYLGEDDALTARTVPAQLCKAIATHPTLMPDLVRSEAVRIVEVSKARFNPRYRGRIVAQKGAVELLLLHVAFCAASADPLKEHFPQTGGRGSGRPARVITL